jgi:aryl-alcohol dehydrogenase-like predicted oxidoreductase
VIAGASNAEQIKQNVNAVTWTLSAEDLAEIDAIAPGPKKPGH